MSSSVIINPNKANNNPRIDFSGNAITGFMDLSASVYELGTQAGDIRLLTAGTDRLHILNNGSVGINNNNPGYLLDISNGTMRVSGGTNPSANYTGIIINQYSNTNNTYGPQLVFNMYNPGAGYYYQGGIGIYRENNLVNYHSSLVLYAGNSGLTAGIEGLRINSSGYVGINQTNPQYQLDVNGSTRIQGAVNTSGIITSTNYVLLNNTAKTNTNTLFFSNASSNPTSSGFKLQVYDFGAGGIGTFYLSRVTSNDLVINPNGNVGINTTSPGYILDVNGSANFAGGSTRVNISPSTLYPNNPRIDLYDTASNDYYISSSNPNFDIGTNIGSGAVRLMPNGTAQLVASSSGITTTPIINANGGLTIPSGQTIDISNANVKVNSSTSLTFKTVIYDSTNTKLYYSTTKTFVIPHPIRPTKYLVHACLEGPESGVYYRGKGEVTDNQQTTVYLPDYVDALATEFTVQITAIYNGSQIQVYNASEVTNNQFTVYGPTGKFNWLVQGKRGDIEVEPDVSTTKIQGDGPYRWI
jgi:hypothetical protein